jgi:ERCC4-related helicase
MVANGVPDDIWESADALSPDDYENFEEAVVDQATAAQTIQELEAEIIILEGLEEQARKSSTPARTASGTSFRKLLQNTPEMHDADGRQRKLIIFTEHRDTLNYLAASRSRPDRQRGSRGHDPRRREARRTPQGAGAVPQRPDRAVLLATDAAGEGVNLQNANLMVNYDLPWNPNRLEQRFGRIHRIGQTEVCHLWNMVAERPARATSSSAVREAGSRARKALGGRVFDISARCSKTEPQGPADRSHPLRRRPRGSRPLCIARSKARWTPSTSKTSSSATPL